MVSQDKWYIMGEIVGKFQQWREATLEFKPQRFQCHVKIRHILKLWLSGPWSKLQSPPIHHLVELNAESYVVRVRVSSKSPPNCFCNSTNIPNNKLFRKLVRDCLNFSQHSKNSSSNSFILGTLNHWSRSLREWCQVLYIVSTNYLTHQPGQTWISCVTGVHGTPNFAHNVW